jgi:hypothetical protein
MRQFFTIHLKLVQGPIYIRIGKILNPWSILGHGAREITGPRGNMDNTSMNKVLITNMFYSM